MQWYILGENAAWAVDGTLWSGAKVNAWSHTGWVNEAVWCADAHERCENDSFKTKKVRQDKCLAAYWIFQIRFFLSRRSSSDGGWLHLALANENGVASWHRIHHRIRDLSSSHALCCKKMFLFFFFFFPSSWIIHSVLLEGHNLSCGALCPHFFVILYLHMTYHKVHVWACF